jgi:hypothetical protein
LFHVGKYELNPKSYICQRRCRARKDPLPALGWFSCVLIDVGDDENTGEWRRRSVRVMTRILIVVNHDLANARVGRLEKRVKRQLGENALDILIGGLLERCIILAKSQPFRRRHAIP